MANKVVDLFLTYQFLRRLATPFEQWDAFRMGIIDKDGNVLRKASTLKKPEELNAWGYFDRLVANLKKLLGKVPGGKSKLASYAAALLLLREHTNNTMIEEDEMESYLQPLLEEEIANVVGSGNIAGTGIGQQGEPAKSKKLKVFKSIMKRKVK